MMEMTGVEMYSETGTEEVLVEVTDGVAEMLEKEGAVILINMDLNTIETPDDEDLAGIMMMMISKLKR